MLVQYAFLIFLNISYFLAFPFRGWDPSFKHRCQFCSHVLCTSRPRPIQGHPRESSTRNRRGPPGTGSELLPRLGQETAIYGDGIERKCENAPSVGAKFAWKDSKASDWSGRIPDSQRGESMTLSVFCCCCVKQLHTRYHPGEDQFYQTLSFEGTRCKKAQFWFSRCSVTIRLLFLYCDPSRKGILGTRGFDSRFGAMLVLCPAFCLRGGGGTVQSRLPKQVPGRAWKVSGTKGIDITNIYYN